MQSDVGDICRMALVIYAQWHWWYMHSDIGDGREWWRWCGTLWSSTHPTCPCCFQTCPSPLHCIAVAIAVIVTASANCYKYHLAVAVPIFPRETLDLSQPGGLKVSGGKFVFFSLRIYYWRWWCWWWWWNIYNGEMCVCLCVTTVIITQEIWSFSCF